MFRLFSGNVVVISIILMAVQCPKTPGQDNGYISKQVRKEKFVDEKGRVFTKITTIIKDNNGERREEQIIEEKARSGDKFDFNFAEFKKPVQIRAEQPINDQIESEAKKPVEFKPEIEPNNKNTKNNFAPVFRRLGETNQSSNPIKNFIWNYLFPVKPTDTVIAVSPNPKTENQTRVVIPKQTKSPQIAMKKQPDSFKDMKNAKLNSGDLNVNMKCGLAVLQAVNNFRAENGKTTVNWSNEIATRVAEHTKNMANSGKLSHDGFSERVQQINADFIPLKMRIIKPAENVAMVGRQIEFGPELVSQIIEIWRKSPGHNANMQLQNTSYAAADCRYSQLKKCWYATLLIAEVTKSLILL